MLTSPASSDAVDGCGLGFFVGFTSHDEPRPKLKRDMREI